MFTTGGKLKAKMVHYVYHRMSNVVYVWKEPTLAMLLARKRKHSHILRRPFNTNWYGIKVFVQKKGKASEGQFDLGEHYFDLLNNEAMLQLFLK